MAARRRLTTCPGPSGVSPAATWGTRKRDGVMDLPRLLHIPLHRSARRAGRPARTLVSLAAAACAVGLVATSGLASTGPQAAAPTVTYKDPGAPVSARVEDLLGRMTLAEKVGQMDQIVVGRLRDSTNPADGNC